MNKVYFLATDGARTMIGKENGLGIRLSAKVPYLKHIHCVAHRCALGIKDLS